MTRPEQSPKSMPEARRTASAAERTRTALFGVSIGLLVAIPLAFTTAVYHTFSLPKYFLLVIGSALQLPLLMLVYYHGVSSRGRWERPSLFRSPQVLLALLYVGVIGLSTWF